VSQGFLDKAVDIYQELIAAAPGNQGYRLRLAELKSAWERQKEAAPAAPLEFPGQDEDSLELDEDAPAWEPVALARPAAAVHAAPAEPGPVPESAAALTTDGPAVALGAPAAAPVGDAVAFGAAAQPAPLASFEPAAFFAAPEEASPLAAAELAETSFPAFEDLGFPAQQPETAAVSEIAAVVGLSAAPEPAAVTVAAINEGAAAAEGAAVALAAGDLATELNSWLENIRRRRDGL